ncbi:uncharacterized protein LOC124257470 [Haliotis rubra]|uniref:uncharacterized protein LOC124257470 n=1 Tax=Haliotis rubra TaxID=36100 RepID=UPI001EE5F4CA|nr:uncharacterized protein LOC124257470 [Haliotis rubra]
MWTTRNFKVPTEDVSIHDSSSDDSAKRRYNWKFCVFVVLLFLLVGSVVSAIIVSVIRTQKPSEVIPVARLQSSLRVTDKTYTPELADSSSPQFKAEAAEFCNQIKETLVIDSSPLKDKDPSCKVLEIRNGSLIFIYEIVVPQAATSLGELFSDLLAQFIIEQSKDGKIGNLNVDSRRECGWYLRHRATHRLLYSVLLNLLPQHQPPMLHLPPRRRQQ